MDKMYDFYRFEIKQLFYANSGIKAYDILISKANNLLFRMGNYDETCRMSETVGICASNNEMLVYLSNIINEDITNPIPASILFTPQFTDDPGYRYMRIWNNGHIEYSSLILAILLNKQTVVKYLLSNKPDELTNSHEFFSIFSGELFSKNILIELNAGFNIAIQYNVDISMIELLLQNGANIDDSTFYTIFMFSSHQTSIMLLLMRYIGINDFSRTYSSSIYYYYTENEYALLKQKCYYSIRQSYIALVEGCETKCTDNNSHITRYLFNDLILKEISSFFG